MTLYADTADIDCNDLYGECNPNNTTQSGPTKQTANRIPTNNNPFTQPPPKPSTPSSQSQKQQTTNFISSGSMPLLGGKKRGFLYSVVFLTALFDNGTQKQGYGILLKDGYVLGAANLLNEKNTYLKNVMAKIQDDSSQSLMCFAMLRLRATNTKLSLLRAENYTDIYCNTRPESFYHQRVNLQYWTPIYRGMLKKTVLSRSDKVLFPFITEKNTLHYTSSSINAIQKRNAGYGLPVFNVSGNFVGFLHPTNNSKNPNSIISSDEVHTFICDIARRKLLPMTDLIRPCFLKKQ
ncbi:hypothetical protein CQA66_03395 [Helicobacter aurati]|uniref:Serine protease n=1 Tax=Helicobacter aurati TaxID=137778 RepID=A0A3D8J630_9HELI|nr:hypothetical protein CQA66_03395 [Helicobacter aurati]